MLHFVRGLRRSWLRREESTMKCTDVAITALVIVKRHGELLLFAEAERVQSITGVTSVFFQIVTVHRQIRILTLQNKNTLENILQKSSNIQKSSLKIRSCSWSQKKIQKDVQTILNLKLNFEL